MTHKLKRSDLGAALGWYVRSGTHSRQSKGATISVHKLKKRNGSGVYWVVRFRDNIGCNRSKSFATKTDADTFDAQVKVKRRTRELRHLDAGKVTLAQYAADAWWPEHVAGLATATQKDYAHLWDRHVLTHSIARTELRDLDAPTYKRFLSELERAKVGPAMRRKVAVVVQGCLTHALEAGELRFNPAAGVRKPRAARSGKRVGMALAPSQVESLRRYFLKRDRTRDAALVTVLAYAGVRPGEALALRWRDVGRNALHVHGAASFGAVKSTKTGRGRSVRLLAPVAADLREWRMASGRPADEALVFPSGKGAVWTRSDWRNWQQRPFRKAAEAAGLSPKLRPYDLRHSFVSLLIAEGASVVEVAAQAGHSANVALGTYAHVIEELAGANVSAEDAIHAARDASRASSLDQIDDSSATVAHG